MEIEKTKSKDMEIRKSRVVTAAQMKEIERKASDSGLSYYQMMENAGSGAADYIMKKQPVRDKKILVFCGKGNNGGDGFVAARKLAEAGAVVTVILVEGEPKTEDAIQNKKLCESMMILMHYVENQTDQFTGLAEDCDLIIDAIYGTGFHGELRGAVREICSWINASNAVRYALDIPSGLNGDTGTADADTVCADETIVFHRLKPAHIKEECLRYCGRIACISIGIEQ